MFAIYQRYSFKNGKEFDMYISKDGLTCNGSISSQKIQKYNTEGEAQKELDYLIKIGRTNWSIVPIN